MHTVIGAFDDRDIARRAMDRLVQSGFDRNARVAETGARDGAAA